MSYKEYIELIVGLKLDNENRIINVIPDVENFAYDALLEWMDSSLETRGGNLIASKETIDILNDFDAGYLKVLNQIKSYRGAVSSFVRELPKLHDVIKDYQVTNNKIDWGLARVGDTQNLVVNEIIKAYTENGLNTEFVQPIRDMLYQNIVAGTNVVEAKESLKDYVKGGNDKSGKLDKYLTQTSQQAVDSYTGAINKKLMETFEYPVLIMSGSLISTSSKQCRIGVKDMEGIIKKEDFENVLKPIAVLNGLVDGTTFKNLPFNKLHWGCRHEFTPAMIQSGDKIGTNEIVK